MTVLIIHILFLFVFLTVYPNFCACVVQTWTSETYQKNIQLSGKSCKSEEQLFGLQTARSLVDCGAVCALDVQCKSFFYHSGEQTCEGCSRKYISSEFGTLPSWTGSACYTGRECCQRLVCFRCNSFVRNERCKNDDTITYEYVCGSYGYVKTQTGQTWNDSKDICYSLGGAPATLDNLVKDTCIQSFLTSTGASRTWAGLYQPTGTDWVWEATGEVCVIGTSYTGFLAGEPNLPEEHCMMMHPSFEYQWVDTLCSNLYHMVCEFPL